jgi:hypothetical protein
MPTYGGLSAGVLAGGYGVCGWAGKNFNTEVSENHGNARRIGSDDETPETILETDRMEIHQ